MPGKMEATNARNMPISSVINTKKTTMRHIIVNTLKIKCKEKILKSVRETRHATFKKAIRVITDFSKETIQAKENIFCTMHFKLLKDSNCQPQKSIPRKQSLKN